MDRQNFSQVADDETDPETITRTHDSNEPPSWTVIEAVAEATDTEPERLRPLFDVVDPDALDAVLESATDPDGPPSEVRVTFRYEGCDVAVRADGRTIVSQPSSTGDGS